MSNGRALLIIDMQVCNLEGAQPAHAAREVLHRVSDLVGRARDGRVPVIYVQHSGPEGAIDEPNTPGWEIHPQVAPRAGELVVHKRHPDAFQDTELQRRLDAEGVRELVVAGLQTEYCVDSTCRRAYSLGYEVVLVRDGHTTWDTGSLTAPQVIAHHNEVLGGWFVQLSKADEVLLGETAGTGRE
jgi:nicotinamidase-related amidase